MTDRYRTGDEYDSSPADPPNPLEDMSPPEREKPHKKPTMVGWGFVLMLAAVLSALVGWTAIGGGELLLGKLLFAVFGIMAAAAFLSRFIRQPA
ncbi:MAG: hypothetical protein ACQEVA_13125 [Myxococcota bacterium]